MADNLPAETVEPAEPFEPGAWLPLTFRGVAAFASASNGRLWFVQLVFAVFIAVNVLIFLNRAWVPIITAAVHALPDEGAIQGERLIWPDSEPVVLGENSFLSFVVDPLDARYSGNIADLQITLLADHARLSSQASSLIGHLPLAYPPGWRLAVNRPELEPWWGAWNPVLRAGAMLLTVVALFASWLALAFLYAPGARLVAFFGDRETTWSGCWRVAGAALMPGALLMGCAIVLHSAGQLTLIHVAFAFALHFVIGWSYVVAGMLCLPRAEPDAPAAANPFDPKNQVEPRMNPDKPG